jgi:phosphate transport system permease protein
MLLMLPFAVKNNNMDNMPAEQGFVFTRESLKKRFRLSEFLSEKIITAVAFLSIAIIVMIFVFVFRETLPIFRSHEKKTDRTETAVNATGQEQYGAEPGTTANASGQEQYGVETTTAPVNASGQEQYGVEPATAVNASGQEQYGVETTTAPVNASGQEQYGVEPATAVNASGQEQYGVETTTAPVNASGQEQYGVEPGTTVNASGQEQYGASGDEAETPVPFAGESESAEMGSDVVTLKSLAGKDWLPVSDHPRYGLVPLFVGTIKITLIAILFAAPIAILAALFSAAFAPHWLRELIKPAIELLAGFPSVVIGFFALMVMASFFQGIFGYDGRLNAFVGGVAMALAAIPIIYTITEDALTAIPRTFTEASLALGASKWQTALFVVLPAATPGIFAAILLGIGRVFGETMIALMATGNAAMTSVNPFESVRTLAATIGAEMAEVVFGDAHYTVLFLIGSLLFVFTFSLNALAEFYVKGKLVKRFQGKS